MQRLALHLVFASLTLLAGGCSDDRTRGAVPRDPCRTLLSCCEDLAEQNPAIGDQCQASYDELHDRDDADQACSDALESLRGSGACTAAPRDGGLGGDGGGAVDGGHVAATSREICEAYVECTSVTTPEGLGAILATYGPEGSCFASASEETCATACLTGLQGVRRVHPAELRCPECFADGDCGGAAGGRACDRSSGTCVECTADTHCGGSTPACRVQALRCVECTRAEHCPGGTCDVAASRCTSCLGDGDCPSGTPFCSRSASGNQCVECRLDGDCASGSCIDGSCCQPETCGQIKADWFGPGSATWICGPAPSQRCFPATVDCGACGRGTCVESSRDSRLHRCSLAGTPCMPGMSGACLGDETCAYLPDQRAYRCAYDLRGSVCVYGSDSYRCAGEFSCDGANLVNDGVCRAYCLQPIDCRSTERCDVYPELGYGICVPR